MPGDGRDPDPPAAETILGLDRDEWYDVYREFEPDATRVEFDLAWEEWLRAMAAHLRHLEKQ